MLGTKDLLPRAADGLLKIARRHVAAAVPKVGGHTSQTGAGNGEGRLDMRQHGSEIGPGTWQLRIFRDRGLDHRGGSLPPGIGQLRTHLSDGDGLH